MSERKYPSQDTVRKYFIYEIGSLIRKERPEVEFSTSGLCERWNALYAGTRAGSLSTNGYIYIKLNGLRFMAHRLVWIYHFGDIPTGMELDHINHQRRDNRIENLRMVTRKQNCRNRALPKRNTSGVVGVTFDNLLKKWKSQINIDGKNMNLGSFSTFEKAVKARKSAENLYGFHENHGC
ncbi:HNH endonuclease [Klebsiella michiganensis]|uniref:HNH endonuclease n=1 Tax=Klebsiella michiganensis TaxID=1134687 RepID=UPI0030D49BDA